MINKRRWLWYIKINGKWETMLGPGAFAMFWITGYIRGKSWQRHNKKYGVVEQYQLRRIK